MPRDLVLGTAGHIDHGKTALVRALTGIDCDRLPQEKQRGITIDIGFAHLDLGDFRLGIVDVPGHERFVRNMLAGASGIDLALLVVSAAESVREQTREHLEILQLLGLRHGLIVLTKCDAVDAGTRELAELEVCELARDTFLADAPVVATSALTGDGLDALRAELIRACERACPDPEADAPLRLAIDRCFVVQGHGTVVTGTVASGRLRVGDDVVWLPAGETVRVRGLQNHGRDVNEVARGQRAAVNLAGVDHARVERGQVLATPGYLLPSRVLTVRLRAGRPMKHRLPVRFHAGTAEQMGTLSLLDCDAMAAGETALGQLFLEGPAVAVWGEPFVLRDSSAEHTLGGGVVLQPAARKVRRRHLEWLERIEQLGSEDPAVRTAARVWLSEFRGLAAGGLSRETGLPPARARAVMNGLLAAGTVVEIATGAGAVLLHADRAAELEGRILDSLSALHLEHPLMTSHDRAKLVARLDYVGNDSLLDAIISRSIADGRLTADGKRVARADFTPKLSQNQRKLRERIIATHREAMFQPPEPEDFARFAGGNAASLRDLFDVCAAEGHLVRVTPDVFLHAEAAERLERVVAERLGDGSGITVAELRDLLGITRKHAVPIAEYLDRVGLTRREGDLRFLARGAGDASESAP